MTPISLGSKLWSGVALATVAVVSWLAYSEFLRAHSPPPPLARPGREWQLVVIGSSTCAASNHPDTQAAIGRIVSSLRQQITATGGQFSTVGVAVDWDQRAGRAFLDQLGHFDETSVGRNWLSHIATRYIWRDLPGPGMVPQLVLVTRTIQITRGAYIIGADSVVKRLAGGLEILEYDAWLSGKRAKSRPASFPDRTSTGPVDDLPE